MGLFDKIANVEEKKRIGRSRISDTNRIRFSKRAAFGIGNLSVIREGFRCPECGNDKAFQKRRVVQCTRCKAKV